MADNVGYTPGTGATVAADDIAGILYQRVKIGVGADGSAVDVSTANPMPISAASLPLPSGAATSTNQPDIRTVNALYSDRSSVVRQSPIQIWSTNFPLVGSGLLESEFTTRTTGTGITVSQASGALTIAMGTTTNAEFLARSVQSFRGAFIARVKTILSQRIVNNAFQWLLADRVGEGLSCTINSSTSISVTLNAHGFTAQNVGQSMWVGCIVGASGVPSRYAIASIPDANTINFTVSGWPASGTCTVDLFGFNYFRFLYSTAVNTTAFADTQRRGWNTGNASLSTNATASPGHIAQVIADGRNAYFSDSLGASSVTPNFTNRGNSFEQLPDDNVDLYLYIWSFNGTSAPASSTTWTIGFVSVESIANVPTYIAGIRPSGASAPIPVAQVGSNTISNTVSITGTVSVNALPAGFSAIGDVGVQYRANATGAASSSHIVSAATTNATVVKAGGGRVLGWSLTNTNAAWRYVKLHNQTTTPTAGTGVVRTIGIPPNGVSNFTLEGGIAFLTGIALTTVTGAADADATAVGANDIVGDIFFA